MCRDAPTKQMHVCMVLLGSVQIDAGIRVYGIVAHILHVHMFLHAIASLHVCVGMRGEWIYNIHTNLLIHVQPH